MDYMVKDTFRSVYYDKSDIIFQFLFSILLQILLDKAYYVTVRHMLSLVLFGFLNTEITKKGTMT